MNKKKLIFDIAITGHHSEYIGHLIDYLSKKGVGETEYFFVVHPEFAKTFPKIHEKAKQIENLHWQPVSNDELQKIKNSRKIQSSLFEFKLMNRCAKKNQVDHVYALDFHTIKYGAIFYRPSYTISSILFLQFHRLVRDTLKQKIEFYKRYYTTKWCIRNNRITRVFVLNDEKTVKFMNNEFDTACFKMLPDPIPELQPLQDFDINTHYGIEKGRKIFLHIGALGHRKGTLEVIESAGYIDADQQEEVTLLLVGKASTVSDENLFSEKIDTGKMSTDVQIIWDNQFVPLRMMKSLFDQCDRVLLPYKNAEFSSGILGHAAAAQKRVIATGAGLIKELVVQHQLGELLETPDAKNIAEKIEEVLHKKLTPSGQTDFVKAHSPEIFAEMILNI